MGEIVTLTTKRCSICGKFKPTTNFRIQRHNLRQWVSGYCNTCKNKKDKTYRGSALIRGLRIQIAILRRKEREKGVRCTITHKYLYRLWEKQAGICALSGLSMLELGGFRNSGRVEPRSPSLDRIIGPRGYIPGNVRFVCHSLNAFRGTMNDNEMLVMARAVVRHLSKRRQKLVL